MVRHLVPCSSVPSPAVDNTLHWSQARVLQKYQGALENRSQGPAADSAEVYPGTGSSRPLQSGAEHK